MNLPGFKGMKPGTMCSRIWFAPKSLLKVCYRTERGSAGSYSLFRSQVAKTDPALPRLGSVVNRNSSVLSCQYNLR